MRAAHSFKSASPPPSSAQMEPPFHGADDNVSHLSLVFFCSSVSHLSLRWEDTIFPICRQKRLQLCMQIYVDLTIDSSSFYTASSDTDFSLQALLCWEPFRCDVIVAADCRGLTHDSFLKAPPPASPRPRFLLFTVPSTPRAGNHPVRPFPPRAHVRVRPTLGLRAERKLRRERARQPRVVAAELEPAARVSSGQREADGSGGAAAGARGTGQRLGQHDDQRELVRRGVSGCRSSTRRGRPVGRGAGEGGVFSRECWVGLSLV